MNRYTVGYVREEEQPWELIDTWTSTVEGRYPDEAHAKAAALMAERQSGVDSIDWREVAS